MSDEGIPKTIDSCSFTSMKLSELFLMCDTIAMRCQGKDHELPDVIDWYAALSQAYKTARCTLSDEERAVFDERLADIRKKDILPLSVGPKDRMSLYKDDRRSLRISAEAIEKLDRLHMDLIAALQSGGRQFFFRIGGRT